MAMDFCKDESPCFDTRIKIGALIYQDFRCFHWPNCLVPMQHGGGDTARDPNMIFSARKVGGNQYDLVSLGYGAAGGGKIDGHYVSDYGNGSILVFGLEWLDPLEDVDP